MEYDFGYQFIIDSIKEISSDIVEVTGKCGNDIKSFVVEGNYDIGNKIFVLGNFVFGDYNVVKHGLVKKSPV